MKCTTCKHDMVERKWKIEFLVNGTFVSVLNFPLLVCPFCGDHVIKHKVNEKVIEKLTEHQKDLCYARAIKFEEIF